MATANVPTETDPNVERWLRLGIPAFGLVLLSSFPLWHIIFVPVILLMAFFIQLQVFHTRSLAKSFWMSTYLRGDSPIREKLQHSPFIHWLSWMVAFPLALITYITLYGYDWLDCIAIAFAIWGA
ncbi:MAG: hypothetical protein RH917_09630 [Lacipirellulaceae bacterium]